MNPFISPEIPEWNFDYFNINEREIECEERLLQQEMEALIAAQIKKKIPGFDSSEQEDESDEEDDDEEDHGWEFGMDP